MDQQCDVDIILKSNVTINVLNMLTLQLCQPNIDLFNTNQRDVDKLNYKKLILKIKSAFHTKGKNFLFFLFRRQESILKSVLDLLAS